MPGALVVRCPSWAASTDVDSQREILLEEAEVREATVRIVTTLGDVKVSSAKISARIRQLGPRGKLEQHGRRVVDGRERPTYRVGDVIDLLAAETKQKSA